MTIREDAEALENKSRLNPHCIAHQDGCIRRDECLRAARCLGISAPEHIRKAVELVEIVRAQCPKCGALIAADAKEAITIDLGHRFLKCGNPRCSGLALVNEDKASKPKCKHGYTACDECDGPTLTNVRCPKCGASVSRRLSEVVIGRDGQRFVKCSGCRSPVEIVGARDNDREIKSEVYHQAAGDFDPRPWAPTASYYVAADGTDIRKVIESFDLNFNRGAIVKYAARAGRKPGNAALLDLYKAREHVLREIARLEGK